MLTFGPIILQIADVEMNSTLTPGEMACLRAASHAFLPVADRVWHTMNPGTPHVLILHAPDGYVSQCPNAQKSSCALRDVR